MYVSKGVLVQNLSDENYDEFDLHEEEPVGETYFCLNYFPVAHNSLGLPPNLRYSL